MRSACGNVLRREELGALEPSLAGLFGRRRGGVDGLLWAGLQRPLPGQKPIENIVHRLGIQPGLVQ